MMRGGIPRRQHALKFKKFKVWIMKIEIYRMNMGRTIYDNYRDTRPQQLIDKLSPYFIIITIARR